MLAKFQIMSKKSGEPRRIRHLIYIIKDVLLDNNLGFAELVLRSAIIKRVCYCSYLITTFLPLMMLTPLAALTSF